MKNTIKLLLLLSFGFICHPFAQDYKMNSIFESYSKGSLNAEQIKVFNIVTKQDHVIEPQIVLFKGKEIFDKNPEIELNISHEIRIEAKSRSIEYENARHWTWFGDIYNEKEEIGYSFISVNMGNLSGEIWTLQNSYHIVPLNDNKGILYKIDRSKLPPAHSPDYPTGALDTNYNIYSNSNSLGKPTAQYNYDVLVCYTNNAEMAVGGAANMNSLIYDSKNQANTVYNNIPGQYANKPLCTIIHTAKVYYNDLNGNWEDHLNWFKNNYTVNQLRNTYGADVAILIVQPQSSGCGLSASIPATSSSAYAVIGSNCYEKKTFVHEIGHLFGGRHQNDGEDGPEAWCHAYMHSSKDWGTVMAAEKFTNPDRIAKFSNPYEGIGDTSWRNVARIHSDRAYIVAGFKPPSFLVTISGPGALGYRQWGTYVGYPNGGSSYQWQKKLNGGSWVNVGSGQFHSEMMWSTGFTLKCTITKNGITSSGTKNIEYNPSAKIAEIPDEEIAISVNYPNPFNPSTNIAYSIDEPSDVTVTVYDIMGNEVINWDYQNVSPGNNQVQWSGIDFNGNKVSAGTYLYTVTTTSKSTNETISYTNKMLLLK